MTPNEARRLWDSHAGRREAAGIFLPTVASYLPEEFKHNFSLAMDAQPDLVTTSNSGIPAFLTTMIDPDIFQILFAPNKAAQIVDEVRKGSWLDETAMFPVVESTGEVSSYGDFSENGRSGANTNFPQRQSYLYQTVMEYGEREMERAGLARISWASEINKAAVTVLNKFQNLSYFRGVAGLQNYGLQNDPGLAASLTPAVKAAGGVTWFVSGAPNATANEVYNDVVALFTSLVQQAAGLVDRETRMTLAMGPVSEAALTFTNTYGINVGDLLKKNFPNLRVVSAVQYEELSASNPQGSAAGNQMQLIANEVGGQQSAFCAYNEKLRSHPIIRAMSSFKQKQTQGTWGTVIRMPVAFASMVGI